MKRTVLAMFAMALAVFLLGCGGNAPNGAANTPKDGGHGHVHEGDYKVIGKQKIGEYDVQLATFGKATKGKEAVFEVNTGASPEANGKIKDSIYVWISDESGKELSPKVKPDYAPDHNDFDGHCEVPKNAPAKAKAWVQIGDQKASWDIELHAE